MREALEFIALKLVLVENEGVFTEDELKIIRASAFLSCVEENEVCLSATAVARLCNKSPSTVRAWCWQNRIKNYRDYRGIKPGKAWPWYEIPLRTVVDLKKTDWIVDEYINLDIKKVDF